MSSVAEKLQRKSARAGATKQVRLKLVYIDFWSVVKLSFLIAVCFGIMLDRRHLPHLDRPQLDRASSTSSTGCCATSSDDETFNILEASRWRGS